MTPARLAYGCLALLVVALVLALLLGLWWLARLWVL
jgi:hypothetical protein